MKRLLAVFALTLVSFAASAEAPVVIKAYAALDTDNHGQWKFATDYAIELFAISDGSEFEILLGGEAVKPLMGKPSSTLAKLLDAMAANPKLKVYACTETTGKVRSAMGHDAIKLPVHIEEIECTAHFKKLKTEGWLRIDTSAAGS